MVSLSKPMISFWSSLFARSRNDWRTRANPLSLFQVRDTDRELIDTMVQVLTEISFLDRLPQVLVRSGYRTYVDGDLLIASRSASPCAPAGHAIAGPAPHTSGSRSHPKISYRLGRHERPGLVLDRPVKEPFTWPKNSEAANSLGNSAAIHGDKRSLATITFARESDGRYTPYRYH